MSIQRSLELAVSTLGIGHRTTLVLSKERDKEVALEQKEEYERWKSQN